VLNKFLSFLFVIFFSLGAKAFNFSYEYTLGYGFAEDNFENTAHLLPLGARMYAGYNFFGWFTLGNSFELRLTAQISEANEEKENFQGVYYSYLAPFLSFKFLGFGILYEHKVQGDHVFLNENEQGDRITMVKPEGFRVEFSYKFESGSTYGFFYETLDFQEQKGGYHGDAEIFGGKDLAQVGVSFKRDFGELATSSAGGG